MPSPVDLLDQLANLVVEAEHPRRLAERTLEVAMSLSNGRSGAVFSPAGEKLTLFASRGIDQHVLDAVETIWAHHRDGLLKGEAFYVPDRLAERRLAQASAAEAERAPASFVVVPIFQGDALQALLYLDSQAPHFCNAHDIDRLKKLGRIVAKAVGDSGEPRPMGAGEEGWRAFLEQTPVADLEREKMLLLLNRNEWNIARVARLMGVTRRTVYMRLQRYNIPRERVRKTPLRAKPAQT